METLGKIAWAVTIIAMIAGFIANPLVLVLMVALYGSIYLIGTWFTRGRDETNKRREKWTGL